MTANPSSAATGTEESSQQAISMAASPWQWGLFLFVAAGAGWILLNYTPIYFDLPAELLSADMYSPPELQEAAATMRVKLYWQNSLIKLGFVGLCFGAATLLAAKGASRRQRWVAVVLGLMSGLACGLLTAVLGTYLRRYLDSDVSLPLVSGETRLLVTDTGVYMLTSMLLVLPISLAVLVGGGKQRCQKAISILLAALVTGLVVPLAISVVLPTAQTNTFPPSGLALTAVWLAVLAALTFLFIILAGERPSKNEPGGHEG